MNKISDSGSGDRMRAGIVGRVLRLVFLVIFLFAVFRLAGYYLEYQKQERLQKEAAEKYMKETPAPESSAEKREQEKETAQEKSEEKEDVLCPITVDFAALLAENEDIVGWLYCADTNINYPVLQGKDNDYYLHHSYDRKESRAGALFADAENSPQFADSNTIIYGHHMKNGGMFAHLADFADQEFFDAHPVMWLLTPDETYRVELFGGYLTEAGSESYTIFTGGCEEFDEYLEMVAAALDVKSDVKMPPDGRYIMLSTCEYDFEDARYVLHGRLVPAEGGT